MRIIRIYFQKTGEASYISHLDLQRVMARALRKSGLPVWYSQGFNPHIYMSFSLPLPLMQESIVETMDCKTESDKDDFSAYISPLNKALPKGLVVTNISFPTNVASEIEQASYLITYLDREPCKINEIVENYNSLVEAKVIRKTKRSEQEINLRELVPNLAICKDKPAFTVVLPAGSQLNLNPEILTNFLQEKFDLLACEASILREKVYVSSGAEFV